MHATPHLNPPFHYTVYLCACVCVCVWVWIGVDGMCMIQYVAVRHVHLDFSPSWADMHRKIQRPAIGSKWILIWPALKQCLALLLYVRLNIALRLPMARLRMSSMPLEDVMAPIRASCRCVCFSARVSAVRGCVCMKSSVKVTLQLGRAYFATVRLKWLRRRCTRTCVGVPPSRSTLSGNMIATSSARSANDIYRPSRAWCGAGVPTRPWTDGRGGPSPRPRGWTRHRRAVRIHLYVCILIVCRWGYAYICTHIQTYSCMIVSHIIHFLSYHKHVHAPERQTEHFDRKCYFRLAQKQNTFRTAVGKLWVWSKNGEETSHIQSAVNPTVWWDWPVNPRVGNGGSCFLHPLLFS